MYTTVDMVFKTNHPSKMLFAETVYTLFFLLKVRYTTPITLHPSIFLLCIGPRSLSDDYSESDIGKSWTYTGGCFKIHSRGLFLRTISYKRPLSFIHSYINISVIIIRDVIVETKLVTCKK